MGMNLEKLEGKVRGFTLSWFYQPGGGGIGVKILIDGGHIHRKSKT